jgi:hypothetical protein
LNTDSKTTFTVHTNDIICYHIREESSTCWTLNYTIERLKEHLASVKHTIVINELLMIRARKYYDQAFDLLKIGAFKPKPSFLIYLTDFDNDPRLLKELYGLDEETLVYVLLQAVGRIFEDVNSKLYHNSISKVLKVKTDDDYSGLIGQIFGNEEDYEQNSDSNNGKSHSNKQEENGDREAQFITSIESK